MPFCNMMRCGEWWASSPVLWGSQHPCLLLPTTHLADYCLLGDVVVTSKTKKRMILMFKQDLIIDVFLLVGGGLLPGCFAFS